MTEPSTAATRTDPAAPSAASSAGSPLARIPRWVPGAVVAVLLVAAAVVAGTSGWILLAVATLVLGWLMAVTWPHLPTNGRLMQLALVLAAYAIVLVRLVPRD